METETRIANKVDATNFRTVPFVTKQEESDGPAQAVLGAKGESWLSVGRKEGCKQLIVIEGTKQVAHLDKKAGPSVDQRTSFLRKERIATEALAKAE